MDTETARLLGTECSTESAAVALREVQTLRTVAAAALEKWEANDNPEGRKQCEEDLAALTRVTQLLSMHATAQVYIDRLLLDRIAERDVTGTDPVT